VSIYFSVVTEINQIYSFMIPVVDLFYCWYFLFFFPTPLSIPASTRSLSITASLPITIPLTRCSSRCVPREQPLLRTEYTARIATEGRRRVAMCCDTARYVTWSSVHELYYFTLTVVHKHPYVQCLSVHTYIHNTNIHIYIIHVYIIRICINFSKKVSDTKLF